MKCDLPVIVQAYVTAMLWADLRDETGDALDDYDYDDLAPAAKLEAADVCRRFVEEAVAIDTSEWSDAQLGRDLWLTRNHHGAGFWDRGFGEAGEKLTAIAHSYGECNPYVGDDGRVYTD